MLQGYEDLLLITKGNEYEGHIQGKKRLSRILRKRGFYTWYEVDTGPTETEVGQRCYTVDILGVWQYSDGSVGEIAFEVDGFKGHHSKRNIAKDKFRDRVHWQYQGLPTCRLLRPWLSGKCKVSDDDIWLEIIWQMKTKYGIRI